jgi:hypothetical protein
VDVPEGVAVAGKDLALEIGFVREEAGAVVAVDGEGGRDCGEGGEGGAEAPVGEEAGAVGGYLEACLGGLCELGVSMRKWIGEGTYADFLQLAGSFEDGDCVRRVCELC